MKKIWRIRKQLISACLVAVLVLSMIFVPTKKAYAIAGVDDAAFILAMLAAAGAGYVGYNCFNGGTNPQDDFNQRLGEIEDTLKDCYDKTIAYILTQGGGGGNPDDFDPDNDDPEKKLTTWEKLKQWWKKHPNASLNLAGNGCVISSVLPEFFTRLSKKKLEANTLQGNLSSVKFTNAQLSLIMKYINDYPFYYIACNKSDEVSKVFMFCDSLYLYYSSNYRKFIGFNGISFPASLSSIDKFGSVAGGITSDHFVSNVPFYSSFEEAEANFANDMADYLKSLNPKSVLNTTAKNDALDNEKYEEPVYDNVVLPTEEQMNDYINKLNEIAQRTTDPAQRLQEQQKAMNAFVESITNVSPEPSPDPNPNPNPTPDPSPNPDPSPDPDPSPEPDPDAPATDEEAAKYTADLTTVFPFCIPFDLIRAFKVLSVEGEAPVYEMPLQIDYKSLHVDEHWSIDMSDFSSVIQILRVMETLGFIVGLILVTRKLIRG